MLSLTKQHFDDGFQEYPDNNSPKAGEIKTRYLERIECDETWAF